MTTDANQWDHWPTDDELAALLIDPNTLRDQWEHPYQRLTHARNSRLTAICSCCDKDFIEGGYLGFAPQGRELFRLLICPAHTRLPEHVEFPRGEPVALD